PPVDADPAVLEQPAAGRRQFWTPHDLPRAARLAEERVHPPGRPPGGEGVPGAGQPVRRLRRHDQLVQLQRRDLRAGSLSELRRHRLQGADGGPGRAAGDVRLALDVLTKKTEVRTQKTEGPSGVAGRPFYLVLARASSALPSAASRALSAARPCRL